MPNTEMIMLMTLSHCVVVKVSSGFFGSAAGTSTGGALTASSAFLADSSAFLSCSFAMMESASANFFSAPRVPADFSKR